MRNHHLPLIKLKAVSMALLLGMHITGCAALDNTTSWKEEILLHDGSKLIVSRTQTIDPNGLREPFQSAPRGEATTTFTIPGTSQTATWKSDYGRAQQDNLELLLLGFVGTTPYIATQPNRCHAYNKWGRPNPPYVFFKYDGKAWQRIPLEEFPPEFQKTNVMVDGYLPEQLSAEERDAPFLAVESVNKANRDLRRTPHLLTIMREPIKSGVGSGASCGRMISYGENGGWIGLDWFTDQPSLDACLKFCAYKKVSTETCPCNSIFKGR